MTATSTAKLRATNTGWGVECRQPGRGWTLVAVATGQAHAERLLFDLMVKSCGSADWRVRRPATAPHQGPP